MSFSDLPERSSGREPSRVEQQMRPATASEIEFAVGILASRHYASPEQAFDCLRIAQRRAARKNRDVFQSASPADAR